MVQKAWILFKQPNEENTSINHFMLILCLQTASLLKLRLYCRCFLQILPQDNEILGWCPGPVLAHGEKVSL